MSAIRSASAKASTWSWVTFGAARDYRTIIGDEVGADEYDVSVRMMSMLAPHPAIGLTSAVAVAAASAVRDGIFTRKLFHRNASVLRIGTPAGVLTIDLTRTPDGRLEA